MMEVDHDGLNVTDLSYLNEFERPVSYSPTFSGDGVTTSSGGSGSDSESLPLALSAEKGKSRKRSRNEKNHLGNAGGIYFNQRGNGRIIPHIIVPKILKSDIRRSYATIFSNVYNSCDIGLMNSYLDTFCQRNTTFQQLCSDAMMAKGKKNYAMTGIDAIGEFWSGSMTSTPDLSFVVGQTTLKIRSDGTGVVCFHFQLGGSSLIPEELYQRSIGRLGNPDHATAAYGEFKQLQLLDASSASSSSSSYPSPPPASKEYSPAVSLDSGDTLLDADSLTGIENLSRVLDNSFLAMLMDLELEREQVELCRIAQNINVLKLGGPMRAIPFQVHGVATMHLDSDNKIYYLQFDMLN